MASDNIADILTPEGWELVNSLGPYAEADSLRLTERLRKAGHSPDAVAAFGDDDVARLMADAGIVRNRAKVHATIQNARATLELREDPGGDLAAYVWSFRPDRTPVPRTYADVPTTSPESLALSKGLKRKGFTFVGPTTMYALMEAIGIVDTHLVGSHRRGTSGLWRD